MDTAKSRWHDGLSLSLWGAGVIFGILGGCDAAAIQGPFEIIATFEMPSFREPSGVVYHPGRQTLFVVGDEGDLGEFGLDGSLMQARRLMDASFEGLTVHPATGMLYIAIEGQDRIIEVHPETFQVAQSFEVPRTFQGKTVLKDNKRGLEGIAFVPDAAHPDGGTFFVANQVLDQTDPEDVSGVFQVEIPLDGRSAGLSMLQSIPLRQVDLAGLFYDLATEHLFVISDREDVFLELDPWEGRVIATHILPGRSQEGITVDPEGFFYLAQDSGGLLKLRFSQ